MKNLIGLAALAAAVLVVLPIITVQAQLLGYDDGFADTIPAVLIDIDMVTGAGSIPDAYANCNAVPPTPVNTLFSVGFTGGLAFIDETLYGLEFGGTREPLYLFKVGPAPPAICAIGVRVGSQPVGFAELDSLAYCPKDGFFYSVDFNSLVSPHIGRLIRIDPVTGIGEVVGGPLTEDVRITGLVYVPGGDIFYAVSIGYASRDSALYTIDRTTGLDTFVGLTNLPPSEIESLELDRSVTPARLIAGGDRLYHLEMGPEMTSPSRRAAGNATPIGGSYNGKIWALAFPPSLAQSSARHWEFYD